MGVVLGLIGLLSPRMWLIVGGCVAFLGLGFYAYHSIERGGEQRALQRVEDANRHAEEKAAEGRATVDDCYNSGGDWDRDKRVCIHVPARP